MKCASCKSASCHRIRRKLWMRLIPLTRLYSCDECGCEFLVFFGVFARRIT